MKRTCKRRKAFLGAIIGAVTSIAGSAISAASQRKAQEKQIKRENYINRNQSANNLSAAYSNEEYVDDFLNKTTFKYGGNKTMAELPKIKFVRKLYVNPKYITKNTEKTPAQKLHKTRLTVKRDANVKTYTTDKNFGKRVNRALINTGIDLAGGYTVFPQRTAEKIARTYLNYMTNLIVNGYGKNPVKNTTQKTKSASPVTQTRTAVKRNANTANTVNRNTTRQNTTTKPNTTRQNTTTKPNTPTKANTTTNKPAQRTTQRTTNTSTQRPVKPTVQKTNKPSNAKTTTNKATTTTKTTAQPSRQNTDNKLTFSRAFASARRAGKQTFNWNGKSYTTQLAGEKKNNTSEKTYNTTKLANNRLMDVTETTKLPINTKTNTIPSSSSVIPKSNTLNIADNNGYYDRLKMMKCGGKRKMKCGGKYKGK